MKLRSVKSFAVKNKREEDCLANIREDRIGKAEHVDIISSKDTTTGAQCRKISIIIL